MSITDTSTTVYSIELSSSGEGHTTVNLGGTIVELVTRYNYSAECWTMDILDDQGENILTGLMLVPDVDILAPYEEEKKTLGSLTIAQRYADAYLNPNVLGTDIVLIWTPVGEDAQIP